MKILLMMLYTALFLYAADLSNTHALTLSSAIKIVKSSNLDIKMANFDEQIAQTDIKKAAGQSYGKLDFVQKVARSNDALSVFGFKLTSRKATFNDFGFSQYGQITNNTPPDELNYPGDTNFFQSSIKYEVPLFTGFKLSSYHEIAKAVHDMKKLDKEQLVNEKVYQVKKTFYGLSLLSHTIDNLTIILKNMDRLQATAKEMVKEGYATNIDILEVQAKRGNVERLLNQMKANEQLSYQYLSFLLDQKVSSITMPPQDVTMPTLSDQVILANNINIKKAAAGLDIGRNLLRASHATYYPTVGAFAEVSTADTTFLGNADKHKAYTIGAKLTWNIFSGGVDSALIEKAELQQLKAQTRLSYAKQAIALQIDKIQTQIKSYDFKIGSLKKDVKLASEIYKNYEGRYKEQLVSINDVIIKQSKQIEEILKLQETRNKRNDAIFALEKISNGEK